MVDPRHGSLAVSTRRSGARMQVGAHEAKPVFAGDGAERGDVELLGRAHLAAERKLRAAQQIAVALAEGVVHLDDDGGERGVVAMAVPEADRLEGVAENRSEEHTSELQSL